MTPAQKRARELIAAWHQGQHGGGQSLEQRIASAFEEMNQEAKARETLMLAALKGPIGHTRWCSYGTASGDESDCCDCGLSERRKAIEAAIASAESRS